MFRWNEVKDLVVDWVRPSTGAGSNNSKDDFKSVIPQFLIKPPFGYPRNVNIPEIRRVAASPAVFMCTNAIIDYIASAKWDIKDSSENKQYSELRQNCLDFFDNPNQNKESWESILRKWTRDILEIDSGVIVKVQDRVGRLSQIMTNDGGLFTKNPDKYGIMPEENAYYQYGWTQGVAPIPFNKDDIIFVMRNPQTGIVYGKSPVMVLYDLLLIIMYGTTHDLEYYENNNLPRGILQMVGASQKMIDDTRARMDAQIIYTDAVGKKRRHFHKTPIVNVDAKFLPFSIPSHDLNIIAQQEWFYKAVFACFGVNSTELGYTTDSNKAVDIVQSQLFKKKAIRPVINLLEYHINKEIMQDLFLKFGHQEKVPLKFEFFQYDLEEDIKKHGLYKLQLETGLKTVNEIREQEGLNSVLWGDEPMKQQSQFGNITGAAYYNNENPSEKEEKNIVEGKAMPGGNNVLAPKEREITEVQFKKLLTGNLKKKKENILKILVEWQNKSVLSEVKDEGMINQIENIMASDDLRIAVNEAVKNNYMKGVEKTEILLNLNLRPNENTLKYIQDYVFENIADMNKEIMNDLRQAIQRNVMDGKGISALQKDIKQIFNTTEARAETIARTETTRANNIGHLMSFKETGIEGTKEWVAVMDDRTTNTCKSLNGQIVGIDENFVSKETGWKGQQPPANFNCRSRIIIHPKIEKNK